MIFLKTENGSVKLDKWDTITSKPTFQKKLSNEKHTLEKIIGYYEVKEKVHCSLSTCNQPHNKGYIVVTSENIETVIGNKCGKNIFGIEFDTLSSDFDKFRLHEERKAIIAQGKIKCPAWLSELESLKFKGRDILWATTNIEKLSNSRFVGQTGATEIRNIAKTQNADVSYDTSKIDKKLKALLFTFNRDFQESGEALQSIHIGKMKNIYVLMPENNLKSLYSSIYEDIQLLNGVIPDEAPSPLLAEITQRTNTIETRLSQLKVLFKDAKLFLQRKNLNLIQEKLNKMENVSSEDKSAFQAFLNTL
ncbi:hypothetical protein ABMZ93_18845 [Morganella morganii]|uniref:hypothetical protein n=1 Tax=Morganella morganii TaxID=582 RepID=UPI003EB8E249